MSLKGKTFKCMHKGEEITFTVTRDWSKAVRVRINNSIQAIWIPKCFLKVNEQEIKANISWKLNTKEFKHKLELAKLEEQAA